jgi:hypothetical protein
MALIKTIVVDGEEIDIESMSNESLLLAIQANSADEVSASLYQGLDFKATRVLSETEAYRKLRVKLLNGKRKALVLEAKRRKLEVE